MTIYDEIDAKLVQYRSDSIEIIQEISKKKIEEEENYNNEDVSISKVQTIV